MSQKHITTGVAVATGIVVVGLFFVFGNPFIIMNNLSGTSAGAADTQTLAVQDEVVGTGAAAAAGDTLTVNYTGKLSDGTVFDTSVGKAPFVFTLGAGTVIPGWDQGLVGMKVGGKRLLIIPPSLGYGSQTYGPIPANSTLVFEVELIAVKPAAAAR